MGTSQIHQAQARIAFGVAGLIYLYIHAPLYAEYQTTFLALALFYFIYNASITPWIRRQPFSVFRTLFGPLLDIAAVCFGILIDGGHASGLYFILLIIIFGNGFRYGNAMMLYAQALSIFGLLAVGTLPPLSSPPADPALLFWQLLGLVVIPLYIYQIRKHADAASEGQREAEETSLRLLDHGPLPVFTFDLGAAEEPRILYINKAAAKLLQNTDQPIGASPTIFCLPEDHEEMRRFCRQTLQQARAEPYEIYVRGYAREGDPPRLVCTGTHIHWRGKDIGVCFIQDVTEREHLRQELEQTHRRGYMSTLVAGVVHDFRNILTSIIGHAEVLQMESRDAHVRKQLEAIIEAGERGSEAISQLLTLAKGTERVGSDRITAAHRPVLERIIGLARFQIPPHVRLRHTISDPLPTVDIGIVEIEQILLNLISNAAQAIRDHGEIHVHIEPNRDAQGALELRIRVRDDGIGIPEGQLELVTKPFWTSREKEGGTGLGLTMVQRIVRRHRGQLHIDSAPGKGTTVEIRIPASAPHSGTPKPPAAEGDESSSSAQHNAHILLVDDAEEVLKIHQALILRMGYTVTTAKDGCEALKLLAQKKHAVDLVVTDYRMPNMDGLEFLRKLRRRFPELPVIMITAYGEDEQLHEAGRLGATLLNKPVNFHNLRQVIQRSIDSRQSARSP